MKRLHLIISLLLLSFSSALFAQKDTSYWKTSGLIGMKMSQSSYKHWSAGGENSFSGIASFNFQATYTKDKIIWDNVLLADLGYLKQGKEDAKKTDDRLEFNSKLGLKASKSWYWTGLFNFKTQMFQGYDYGPDTPVLISDFMAPAYIKLAIGGDYKPAKNFSMFVSPITGKMTYVNSQDFANAGDFGLTPAEMDGNGNLINASKIRLEMGAYLRANYSVELMKNILFQTKIELFTNYLKNPQNIDVDWELNFNFKINDYFNASLLTHLIYDDDIHVGIDNNNDGTPEYQGPRLQVKEVLGLGISYKF